MNIMNKIDELNEYANSLNKMFIDSLIDFLSNEKIDDVKCISLSHSKQFEIVNYDIFNCIKDDLIDTLNSILIDNGIEILQSNELNYKLQERKYLKEYNKIMSKGVSLIEHSKKVIKLYVTLHLIQEN